MEKFELVGSAKAKEVLCMHPDYRVFWRCGYAFRGAQEREVVKSEFPKVCATANPRGSLYPPIKKCVTFKEYMLCEFGWAAAIDICVDNEKKELHFNGFSCNDLE